ncbi:MAG: hypothetical protein WD851_20505 [Pirellulales bacterium]
MTLILADTNLTLRMVERDHVDHQVAMSSVRSLRERSYAPAIVPQVVYEFWVVATRPKENNGLGMAASEAIMELDELLPLFRLLRDERSIYEHWFELVARNAIVGKRAHDARIVAAMLRHQISYVLTFNSQDFFRYAGVQVVDPRDISSLPALGR